jgi:hypothetical protein
MAIGKILGSIAELSTIPHIQEGRGPHPAPRTKRAPAVGAAGARVSVCARRAPVEAGGTGMSKGGVAHPKRAAKHRMPDQRRPAYWTLVQCLGSGPAVTRIHRRRHSREGGSRGNRFAAGPGTRFRGVARSSVTGASDSFALGLSPSPELPDDRLPQQQGVQISLRER